MAQHENSRGIPLPRGWPRRVKSAMLNVIALAQHVVAYTRSWVVNGRIAGVRLKAENGHLRQQVALLTEEIRIQDARMKRVDVQKRPHYVPTERMVILRQGQRLLVLGLQALVSPQANPPAVRRCGAARKHRRD